MVEEDEPGDERQVGVTVQAESFGNERLFDWFRRLLESRCARRPMSKSRLSFAVGIFGVAMSSLVSMLSLPIGIKLINYASMEFIQSVPWLLIMVTCLIYAPAAAGFSNAVFVPCFCYHALLLRFVLAYGIAISSFACVMGGLSILFGFNEWNEWVEPAINTLCFVLGVASVTVLIQLASRWSLCPSRDHHVELPRLSVAALMQLMLVVAVLCVAARSLVGDTPMTVRFLAPFLVGTASAVASFVITVALMAEIKRWKKLAVAGFGVLVSVVAGWVAWVLYRVPSIDGSGSSLLAMLPFALLDGVVISLVFLSVLLAQLYWLRGCGWTVVSR